MSLKATIKQGVGIRPRAIQFVGLGDESTEKFNLIHTNPNPYLPPGISNLQPSIENIAPEGEIVNLSYLSLSVIRFQSENHGFVALKGLPLKIKLANANC